MNARSEKTNDLLKLKSDAEQRKAPPLEKETRFAVVMYGGVSLAIYIYGVTKELYGMVRATARTDKESEPEYLFAWDELTDTEKVYRKVGELFKTKFVVDILSGTSAGGINAIYLAKALANGQSIDGLKDIWLDQGDMSLLINDKKSETGLGGLKINNAPSSLLNSQRMYFHLFKALHEMETGGQLTTSRGLSPFVDELDLNITATDIRGLTIALPVSNARVRELRFRNVFRFHYSTTKAAGNIKMNSEDVTEYSNDFKMVNNPFLAYAARCTSSFPFAFEPMRLDDIASVLRTTDFKDDYKYQPDVWTKFYKDYHKSGDDFPQRAFGDGGYLDNKPFSYATETLLRRRADQLVDRKLIYIDPSPEHPDEILSGSNERPDVIENVMAALFSTPRYEPIREDLEKVIERNKMIRHLNHILNHLEDIAKLDDLKIADWQRDSTKWSQKYFDGDLVEVFGTGYATYHQLRVGSVLDNLGSAIARAFNWDESGKEAEDLAALMDGWRREKYTTRPELSATHRSENEILFRLDLSYRLRRMQFLFSRVNILLDAALALSEPVGEMQNRKGAAAIELAKKMIGVSGLNWETFQKRNEKISTDLKSVKSRLNDIYGAMRACGRKLRIQNLAEIPQNEEDLKSYTQKILELRKFLERPGKNAKQTELEELVEKLDKQVQLAHSFEDSGLEQVFNMIEDLLDTLSSPSREGYLGKNLALASMSVQNMLGKRSFIQRYLLYFWERYEYYDMLMYPITFGTEIGESDEVEIIRVSPQDAVHFIDESGTGRRKLAGTKLANFSALLNREWRENDMLWGRLDAVEILLKEMLSDGDPEQYPGNFQKLRELMNNEVRQPSLEDSKNGGRNVQIDPLEMALEGVLDEDLKPKDKSIFYKFINGTLVTRVGSQEKRNPNERSPELDELIKQDRRLSRLETDISQMLNSSLGQLENLNRDVNSGLANIKSSMKDQLDKVKHARKDIAKKIKAERKRLEDAARAEDEKRRQELARMDDEESFIESFDKRFARDIVSRLSGVKETNIGQYRDLLRSMPNNRSLSDMFRYGYQINTNFEPEASFEVSSRALQVTSKIIGSLAEKHPALLSPSKVLAKTTKLILSIVQLAIPSSLLGAVVLRSWVWLAYMITSIIVIAGNLMKMEGVTKFGSTTLVSVFGIHMAILLVRSVITKGLKSIRYWIGLLVLILLGLATLGLMYLGVISDEWLKIGYLVTKEVAVNWYSSMNEFLTFFKRA